MCGGIIYIDSRVDGLRGVLGGFLPEHGWRIELRELCSRHSAVAARCRFFFELRGLHGGHVLVIGLDFVHGLPGRKLLERIGDVLQ